ncbi:MAG: dUTP diphosphatase [Bacteroidetes bacterium SW_11_45_7]|nr:MAG: dUTP diphosphatase [Bacteroidetes bacterium SW_11_45_7]
MEIKMINKSNHELPSYETEGAAGFDLRANVDEPIVINPFERKLVPTGIFMELPQGYEAQIRPRSGIAVKKGLTLLNTPGTIDSDYRGEVKVLMINLSDKKQSIKDGERIAQTVISRYEKVGVKEVARLGDSERGDGGFGHTGSD